MIIFVFFLFFFISTHGADGNQDDKKPPKGLTIQSVVRTPAAHNKVVKVRLKDIARFAGIRDNQLVGYGLVVGLNGTGDTLSNSPYTKESLTGMLERLGVNIRTNKDPSGKNVAAVMVTAKLPPFARTGTTIDLVVSALGDAKDLNGGTLLVTPLMAADGEVYAVGQGEVIVSGTSALGIAASQTTGIPTTGKIPNGAIVEKEIPFRLTDLKTQTLSLRNHDLTTARRITEMINEHFKHTVARTKDSGSIEIDMPKGSEQHIIEAMTQIEQLEIEPDHVAKVIIDPSGVIVLGHNVRISPVALTHGSVTVRIAETPLVSQPNPFTQVINPLANNAAAANLLGAVVNGVAVNPQNPGVTQNFQFNGNLPAGAIGGGAPPIVGPQQPGQLAGLANALNNAAPVQQIIQNPAGVAQNPGIAQNLQANGNPQAGQQPNITQNGANGGALQAAITTNTALQQATIIPHSEVTVNEEKGKFAILDNAATLDELVNALNNLGTSPREMAQILQAIKAAGAMHAEVVVN